MSKIKFISYFLLLFCCSIKTQATEIDNSLDLEFTIQAWQAIKFSDEKYDIPRPISEAKKISFRIENPDQEGSATLFSKKIELSGVNGEFKFYWVNPWHDTGYPKYFNI